MPRVSNTTIEFYNVPWDSEYRNLRYFASASARNTWFSNRASYKVIPHGSSTDKTYVSKGSPVRYNTPHVVATNWDNLRSYNYMRFKNSAYDQGDWIYCFIDKLESVNEHATRVYFHADAWINNIGNLTFHKCFIERCHTKGDRVTQTPEPFSIKRYVCKKLGTIGSNINSYNYILLATRNNYQDESADKYPTCSISGIDYSMFMYADTSLNSIILELQQFANVGRADSIIGVYCVPKSYMEIVGVHEVTHVAPVTKSFSRYYGSSKPVNNKCLLYPYTYCVVHDNQTTSRTYKWEDGTNGTLKFRIDTFFTPGSGVIELRPEFTYNDVENLENMIHNIEWASGFNVNGADNYLARNAVQIKAQQTQANISTGVAIAGGVIGAGTALATGGVGAGVGASIASTALSATSTQLGTANSVQAQTDSAKFQSNPYQAPDNSISYFASKQKLGFEVLAYYPASTELSALDDFFTRFGYSVNTIAKPTPTNRSSFYYVKTNGAVVRGKAPQEDRNAIMNAMDRGVTFWNTDDIGNYSLSNT